MALYARLSTSKNFMHLHNCIGFLWPSLKKSTSVDVIDSFTSELVAKKAEKWELLNQKLKRSQQYSASFSQGFEVITKSALNETETINTKELGLDIRSLSQAQLDNLILSTLKIKNKVDFLYLAKQCITWRILPSDVALVESLKYLSSLGRTDKIDQFAEVCKIERNPIMQVYSNLAPFKAMALWRNGRSDSALEMLQKGYAMSTPDACRKMIKSAFRIISEETLAAKSDAVLVSLLHTAVLLFKEHKEIFVIACVWKSCFLSDWFSDQETSAKLFEDYPELRALVHKRSSPLCTSFLRQHNVDAVHRLIELFLKHNMMEPCGTTLGNLFDYHYYRKNLRACAEIVKSSTELDLPLSDAQNEKFLSLFLDEPVCSTKPQQRRFEYKF